MDKILVSIYVLSIDENYDVLLPIITIPKSKVEEVLGIRISDSFLFTPSFVIIPGCILEWRD